MVFTLSLICNATVPLQHPIPEKCIIIIIVHSNVIQSGIHRRAGSLLGTTNKLQGNSTFFCLIATLHAPKHGMLVLH